VFIIYVIFCWHQWIFVIHWNIYLLVLRLLHVEREILVIGIGCLLCGVVDFSIDLNTRLDRWLLSNVLLRVKNLGDITFQFLFLRLNVLDGK